MNSDPSGEQETGPRVDPQRLLTGNAVLGLVLFCIYLVFYAGFVLINAFAPTVMGNPIVSLGGINLAIVYGFSLIVMAFVLAVVYMFAAKRDDALEGGR